MLSHIERKVLRIIVNNSFYGKISLPTLDEYSPQLSRRLNKTESEVMEVLQSLDNKGYIRISEDGNINTIRFNE